MSFKELLSNPKILQAIEESGYTVPTPIQEKAIPEILKGHDVQGSAQTGTGKTAAFVLPTLELLAKTPPQGKKPQGPRVLILVPTRELAMQVAKQAEKYSKYFPKMKTVCIYGGAPYPAQNRDLSRPYEILVATPGRLMDHMQRGRIPFSRLELLILDEADRMLDMGFIDPVKEIAAKTPKTRQTLMFSATFAGNVLKLAKSLLINPVEIAISAPKTSHKNIEQHIYPVDDITHKYKILDHFLEGNGIYQAIIFTATKRQADNLVQILIEKGHSADALHGDMNQRQRTRTIEKLRKNKVRLLVATDVAARGIDVQTISHVINFDLPNSAEDYVHRIGRTGRAGKNGIAYSLASPKDQHLIKDIEKYTGKELPDAVVAGLEPKPRKAVPRKKFAPRRNFRKPYFKKKSGRR
jgi:superfamily II DNA/RNA helicase